ncbi:GNAT family N-acetyltransferase [Cellulosimicrobium arenosum]|uniref:Lysine N-acyltransferase MbtK n=1 Tax=Cellulosimicrobium arenosum TaxID=2708133 RepID=A0A927G6F5_9MICO|nr:GNAT family N-acetyltransferase [Cellulosimicrobium arenosum]MBD8077789.1 acetyltransferase [Cellulosimicrobium arenosum]
MSAASQDVTRTPTPADVVPPAPEEVTAPAAPGPAVLLRTGEPGRLVLRLDLPVGRVEVHALDPAGDLDVVHAWVNEPRASFWGLAGLSRDELRELYAYVASLPTHHAFLVRWDSRPVALLQTYDPAHDPVGAAYAVQDGDVGVHFFLGARGPRRAPVWTVLGVALVELVVCGTAARRVVVEPDAANDAALRRLLASGFTLGPCARVGDKDARLAFLDRSGALALHERSWAALDRD